MNAKLPRISKKYKKITEFTKFKTFKFQTELKTFKTQFKTEQKILQTM